MAIYGFGAYYDSDMSRKFIDSNVACIGWDYLDSPYLHEMMYRFKIGDLVYLKKYVPPELIILAAGIVVDCDFKKRDGLGNLCCKVKWLWDGELNLGKIEDKFTRSFTLFEEHHPEIQKLIVDLILDTKYSEYS